MRKHLTTKAMASYVLKKNGHNGVQRVLYLSKDLQPDYMRCLLLHGFKELFGAACHDFVMIPHLYTDYPPAASTTLYGRGITYSRLLDKSIYRNIEADRTIEQDIMAHKYDVVIYGSVHRGLPYWDLVHRYYASKDIVLVCGEDIHACTMKPAGVMHDLFIREL